MAHRRARTHTHTHTPRARARVRTHLDVAVEHPVPMEEVQRQHERRAVEGHLRTAVWIKSMYYYLYTSIRLNDSIHLPIHPVFFNTSIYIIFYIIYICIRTYLRRRHPPVRGAAQVEAEVPAQVQVEHQVEVGLVLEGVVGGADEAGPPHLVVCLFVCCLGGGLSRAGQGWQWHCDWHSQTSGWAHKQDSLTVGFTSLSSVSSRSTSSSMRRSRITLLFSIFMAYHFAASGWDFFTTALTLPKPPYFFFLIYIYWW
jgi:hypothetical protein